jgi:hypothetical protein
MPILTFRAEDIRDPLESYSTVIRNEDAESCYGEYCGQYHEVDGEAVKPRAHNHLVITGQHPETTPRYHPVSK